MTSKIQPGEAGLRAEPNATSAENSQVGENREAVGSGATLTPQQRIAVVEEAISWVEARTPYVPHAQLKGLGCDCATFILCVYRQVGLIPEIDPGAYNVQEHLHHETTEYVDTILKYSDEIPEADAQPGDLVLWRVAHAFAHGGIVVAFPTVIHSMMKHGVIYSNANIDCFLQKRPRRFFRRNFLKPFTAESTKAHKG
jgi:cell wall-associated NlpC family hydrolase